MNVQSILLLTLIVVVAGIVLVRYVRVQRRTGGCGTCQCGDCPHCNMSARQSAS